MFLTREIAYEIHTGHYIWGKKKPPKKDAYWDLDASQAKKKKQQVQAMRDALKEYRNGNAT